MRHSRTVTSNDGGAWDAYAAALGERLREARERSGLTQEQVARAAGIATYTYQKLENGESNPGTPANPRLQTLVSLARVLGVDASEVLPHDVSR